MTTSTVDPWAAPVAHGPVHGTVAVPGSKSVTNRALLLAALADAPSTLYRPLVARDTTLMQAGLQSLGTGFTPGPDRLDVAPRPLRGPADIDCGLAGTVMRFLPPVAALADGSVTFDGDERARQRPLDEVLSALRTLGVALTPEASSLPFRVDGAGSVEGGVVTLDASESSQFVSALLLAGARYRRGVDVRHSGKPIPSTPHIEMTVDMLRRRDVVVDDAEPNRWVVVPGAVAGIDVEIEPDLSNTAPFLAAAVVTGGTVTVPRWPQSTTQAGDQLRPILDAMGARVELGDTGLTVSGTGAPHGVDLDLHDVGELAPVIAAVAAVADSTSWLRGIAHLRGHETDRLAALTAELRGLGSDVRELPDGLEIRPRPLTGGLFHCYADHRMAQAGAVLGLVVPGVELDDVATTAKTYPHFADAWTALVA